MTVLTFPEDRLRTARRDAVAGLGRRVEQLQERAIGLPVDSRIDEVEPSIDPAPLLGLVSANGRRYLREAAMAAIPHYDGRSVYLGHDRESGERDPSKKIGWITHVRESRNGGLCCRLNLFKSHPTTPVILEAARRYPAAFGLSHNAEGKTSRRDGETIVEQITSVRSVDLVAEPATTKAILESLRGQAEPSGNPGESAATSTDAADVLAQMRDIRDGADTVENKWAAAERLIDEYFATDTPAPAELAATPESRRMSAKAWARWVRESGPVDGFRQVGKAVDRMTASLSTNLSDDEDTGVYTPPTDAAEFARRCRGDASPAEMKRFRESCK